MMSILLDTNNIFGISTQRSSFFAIEHNCLHVACKLFIPLQRKFLIIICRIYGPDGKEVEKKVSPTLKAVLREDQVKRQTGYKPSVNFYHNHREYGPGYGPLRQYEEIPDTLDQEITVYNKQQDRSLSYPMWSEC